MDLESIMLSGISQSEKHKYYMIHLYMESNEQTELTKWRHTRGYREQTDSCQRGGIGGWVRRVKGLSKKKKDAWTQTTVW